MIKRLQIGIVIVFITCNVAAQSRYKKYDSIFYERIFSPTFSTMMMPKGFVEVISNNSLITSNQFWGDNNKLQDINKRYTYYYSILQTNIGISSKGRVSVGLDFYYTMGRRDSYPENSPLYVFNPGAPGNEQSESALTAISPRLKFVPFRKYKNLIYQTSLTLPVVNNVNRKNFLGPTRVSWNNQFLYSIRISKRFMSFAQADVDVYFKNSNTNNSNQYYVPLNFYVYWILTKHIFPYASIGSSVFLQSTEGKLKNQYTSFPVSAGVQYQFSLRFNVSVSYSKYVYGQNINNWTSMNIGLRGVF